MIGGVRLICLHGPESTGKSTLAEALARHFDTIWVPEYGRTYCEEHGTDFAMSDLVAMAKGQYTATLAAIPRVRHGLLFLDTDPLMTAVWADMTFGKRDPWFDRFADVADLYLVPGIDLPFAQDDLRLHGSAEARQLFYDLSVAELDRRGVRWATVDGPAGDRQAAALAAIGAAGIAPID
ncbi:nicotinamide-nucleotide adenylyltransferase, NadR type [Sphingomonas sp. YR710]|uniref:AAA family ATPase n=1 Tax=Sphingomonas sp. YR710 TaxID=1882773 RepID=UPI000888C82F|nr:ATP-binding protein [Sphingomonas sp. YR710]SDC32493.1 nicotinamide-nucleotide adenylyltransferase, NadR type [Sphingomonas sp. YR710]